MSEPPKVVLDFKVYKEIVEQTRQYGAVQTPRDQWREVYGFLFGTIDPKTQDLIIFAQAQLKAGGTTDVEFNDTDYLRASEIESQYFDKGGFLAGWWHTHPNHSLFLSGTDKLNQMQQSANARYIALVFDFTKVTPDYAGMEIFQLQNPGIGIESTVVKAPWQFSKPDWKYIKKLSQELDKIFPLAEREKARQQVLQDQGGAAAHLAQKDAKGEVFLKRAEQFAEMKEYDQSNALLMEQLAGLEKANEMDLYFDALVLMGNNLLAMGRDAETTQVGVQLKSVVEERKVKNYYLPGMAEYFIGRGLFAQGPDHYAQSFDHLKEAVRQLATENYFIGVGRIQEFLGTTYFTKMKKNFEAMSWWHQAKRSYIRARTTTCPYRKYYETDNYLAGLVHHVDNTINEHLSVLSASQMKEIEKLKQQLGLE